MKYTKPSINKMLFSAEDILAGSNVAPESAGPYDFTQLAGASDSLTINGHDLSQTGAAYNAYFSFDN